MNITIEQLERNAEGGVMVVHWIATKTSGDHTASAYGTEEFFPDSSTDGFIPFESLTQDTVISWIRSRLDTDGLEYCLDDQLAQMATPRTIEGVPW